MVVDDSSPFPCLSKTEKRWSRDVNQPNKMVVGSWTTAHKWPWRFCFFVVCIGFYSILSVSRCANGPFFYLVFSFLVFFLIVGVCFFGGFGGGVITSCRVRFT